MPKFDPLQLSKEGKNGYSFFCPGCEQYHMVQTNPKFKPCWQFNGNVDKPTVAPSILVRGYTGDTVTKVCHSFIKDGNIQFLNDCTHKLAGQTVELPEWK